MYLPEDHAQMFDILSELRLYASVNGLPGLAEKLDDALMLLAAEGGVRAEANRRAAARPEKV